MAKPELTIWPIVPHTSAKHTILRSYLDAWFPILLSWNQRVVFLDGFAGPGLYAGGEKGSPIIALESAIKQKAALSKELVFLFIEERKTRADQLRKEIDALGCPANFHTKVECGEFEDKLTKILNDLDESKHRIAPTFALIDPFGFKGIPFRLLERLLRNKNCELLVNFMVVPVNRFRDHPDEDIRKHIRNMFGSDAPFEIPKTVGDREDWLRDLYHQRLRTIARYVVSFEMRSKKNRVVYHLFFASNNKKGHEKMKGAMWKVDPSGEFTFSDAMNPGQQDLLKCAYQGTLKSDLRRRFANEKKILIERVVDYVIEDTAFLPRHMREVLSLLESEGGLNIEPKKCDGKSRVKNTFPPDAYITFQ